MADYIRVHGKVVRRIAVPLSVTALHTLVGIRLRFVELLNGDFLIVSDDSESAINPTASTIAGKRGPIYGNAVLCSPEEIA